MIIDDFCKSYPEASGSSIDHYADKWLIEKQVDDLLGTSIASGVVFGDLLVGDGLRDQISHKLFEGVLKLKNDETMSYSQVREFLVDRIGQGDPSVAGIINGIKGHIGEMEFLKQAGSSAALAPPNQEGWDIKINHDGGAAQYIQIKMYDDPSRVIQQMQEVQDKVDHQSLIDGQHIIHHVDFAVPYDIADAVKQKAQDLNLHIHVVPINGMTADDAKHIVEHGIHNIGQEALQNFFGELFSGTLSAAALHAAVNGYLMYKGAKDATAFIEDTAISSFISGGGICSGMVVENVMRKMSLAGGLPTFVVVFATSITTRMILRRIADRRHFVKWAQDSNINTGHLVLSLA